MNNFEETLTFIKTRITFHESDKDDNVKFIGRLENVTNELIPNVGDYFNLHIYKLDEDKGDEIVTQKVVVVNRYVYVYAEYTLNDIHVTVK